MRSIATRWSPPSVRRLPGRRASAHGVVVGHRQPAPLRSRVRAHEQAADRGHDNLIAGARAASAAVRRQSFAGWPYAREERAREERGRSPQVEPSDRGARDVRGDPRPRGRRHRCRVVGGSCCVTGASTDPGRRWPAGPPRRSRRRSASGASRSSARGPACGRSCIDDAATATLAAVERGTPGLYNIVDDDPAPVSEWLPALADAIGAKPPRRVPVWVGRLVGGPIAAALMIDNRGASNAKAKRELGWEPAYPSWREGFPAVFG